MAKARQILFLSFLSGLLFGCKEKYPDLSLTAEQDEPDYMAEVRASRIYEFVGKGLLILFHKAQRGEVDLMGKPDWLFLFFVLKKTEFLKNIIVLSGQIVGSTVMLKMPLINVKSGI